MSSFVVLAAGFDFVLAEVVLAVDFYSFSCKYGSIANEFDRFYLLCYYMVCLYGQTRRLISINVNR